MIPHISGRTLLYLAACLLCATLCFALGTFSPSSSFDLRSLFYGARALIHGHDPYQGTTVLNEIAAEKTDRVPTDTYSRQIESLVVYPPSTLVLLTPLTPLSWRLAQPLWLLLSGGGFVLAGFLLLKTAIGNPRVSAVLASWVIANGESALWQGNPAALSVATAVIAVWCFVEERLAALGVILLALSLIIKPQNAGFPWLFLLLAGGVTLRRRTLKSLGLVLLLAVPSALWMNRVSPHWTAEITQHLKFYSQPGFINDDGPDSISFFQTSPIVDLQTDLSVLWNNSAFYNSVTYATVAAVFLALVLAVRKIDDVRLRLWYGLAAAVPLEMIVSYHHAYDAKLLLLAIPACALLWERGGAQRWLSISLTSLALFLTGDIPLAIQNRILQPVFALHGTLPQRLWGIVAGRPIPLVLLALAVFYLVVCIRATRGAIQVPNDSQHPQPIASF